MSTPGLPCSPLLLTALVGQLQIGHFCRESLDGAAFTLRVIELLSASIKIHSYSFIYRACIQSLSNEMMKLLKLQFATHGPSDEPLNAFLPV